MIKCRAIEEKSIYVAATGQVLPCCFLYYKFSNNSPVLQELLENNFKKLVESWAGSPYKTCFETCDDGQTDSPLSMTNIKKQWVIKNGD